MNVATFVESRCALTALYLEFFMRQTHKLSVLEYRGSFNVYYLPLFRAGESADSCIILKLIPNNFVITYMDRKKMVHFKKNVLAFNVLEFSQPFPHRIVGGECISVPVYAMSS